MTPFAAALSAGQAGEPAVFQIVRDDGFAQDVPVAAFFETASFPLLETRALEACCGSVLDVGAGAGRHSLALAARGLEVWSLDILPGAVDIMRTRNVPHPVCGDILSWSERDFDTLLLLMNGIGMVGTPDRLDRFLIHARNLLKPGGQILLDSIDVFQTNDPRHIKYRENNLRAGRAAGQQSLRIGFRTEISEPFPWLHLAFPELAQHAIAAGWQCALLGTEPGGHYLARLML